MRKALLYISITALIFSYGSSFHLYALASTCTANLSLPDSACTPGAILTTDREIICTPGYTQTVRNVPLSRKKEVFSLYGIPWENRASYSVDHLISLQLGGSNEIANLWPETNDATTTSFSKDKFENYLHKQMCSGEIEVTEAQRQIATDWLKYDMARLNLAQVATSSAINSSSTPRIEEEVIVVTKKTLAMILKEVFSDMLARIDQIVIILKSLE